MASVKDLISSGMISAGDKLGWNRKQLKKSHEAVINQDGTISTTDGKAHKSPSGAAKHLNDNKPVDGWNVWVHLKTGKRLAELRNQLKQ